MRELQLGRKLVPGDVVFFPGAEKGIAVDRVTDDAAYSKGGSRLMQRTFDSVVKARGYRVHTGREDIKLPGETRRVTAEAAPQPEVTNAET